MGVFAQKKIKRPPGVPVGGKGGKTEMTKDAEKVLLDLYRSYSERRKTMDRTRARDFSGDEARAAVKSLSWVDAHDAMSELQSEGYIECYFVGGCELKPSAIEYGDTRIERAAEKVLDVVSKLKP